MQTTLILLSILCVSFIGQAQSTWAPLGAEWYFAYESFKQPMGDRHAIYHYRIEKDTIVLDQECRLMSREIFWDNGEYSSGKLYTFSQNDSIYLYRPSVYEGFRLEFDFGAEENDSLSSYTLSGSTTPEWDTANWAIWSVSTITLGDLDLKQWIAFYEQESNVCGLSQNYVERIGRIKGFDGTDCITANESWTLRCYQDSSFNYSSGIPCDSLVLSDGLNLSAIAKVEIFPNPVQESLSIKLPEFSFRQTSVCFLIDLQGRKVKTLNTEFANTTYDLDVADLDKGIYFLTWAIDGEIIGSRQVFVN